MHAVITEENPKFIDIDEKVVSSRPRLNFLQIAEDLKNLIIKHQGVGHVVVDYSHDQTSNIVYALRRHKLEKGRDYSLTKITSKDDLDRKVEQIVLSPISGTAEDEALEENKA